MNERHRAEVARLTDQVHVIPEGENANKSSKHSNVIPNNYLADKNHGSVCFPLVQMKLRIKIKN